jgi:hypothetical protein
MIPLYPLVQQQIKQRNPIMNTKVGYKQKAATMKFFYETLLPETLMFAVFTSLSFAI